MTTSMTTTSERRQSAAASPAAARYTRQLLDRQASARYPDLADAVRGHPLCRLDGYGDGLTTVAFRQRQLPDHHLRGVLGFRLVQFLQAGLMDPELVHRRGMAYEPLVEAAGPDTVHVVTLTAAGQLVGCVALVGAPDPEPLPLDSPQRRRFPAEQAHDVDLLSPFAAPGRTTHHAYEVKRFARDPAMARGEQRARVPWHLILAVGKVTLALGEELHVLLGDSGERGALRHLRALGLDLVTVEGTTPTLPRTELMWPSYLLPDERRAKPFVATLPPDSADIVGTIESALLQVRDADWQQQVIARLVELHQARGLRAEVRTA
jgi:hypothetical protein